MSAKVSVIIPVYNVEKYLREALDSVVNQTLKDIEIICVDDCSPDNCPAILDEYASKDSRVKVIHLKENGGAGRARNIALDIAEGEYIMFLDPDDWFELDACELAYNQIAKNNDDFVYFNYYKYIEDTGKYILGTRRIEPFVKYWDSSSFSFSDLDTLKYLVSGESVFHIFRKSFLNKNNIRYSTEHFCEDTLFYIHSIVCSSTVSVIPKPIYTYRIHNKSATTICAGKWEQFFEGRYKAYELVKNSENADKYIYPYLIYFISTALYWYNRFSKLNPAIEKDFYSKLKELFVHINKNHDVLSIADYFAYRRFKQIVKYSYFHYKFNQFIQRVFSITNNSSHKIITILNLEFCIKRKSKLA